MPGENEIRLNHAAMCRVVENYLDDIWGSYLDPKPKVTRVRFDSRTRRYIVSLLDSDLKARDEDALNDKRI